MAYDLTGKIYNSWTVLYECERPQNVKTKDKYWMCRCICGTTRPVNGRMLRTNKSKSCGCSRNGINRIDLIGKKIGDVQVIKEAYCKEFIYDNCQYKKYYWICKCSCGNNFISETSKLNTNKKTDCGCRTGEKISKSKEKYNKYIFKEDYILCLDDNNNEFYIDFDDYENIKNRYWYKTNNGYIVSRIKHTNDFTILHRFLLGVEKSSDFEVDHINHIRYDNRKENLRVCTSSQNHMNVGLSKNNTSGVTGVGWQKNTNTWRSRIKKNKIEIILGYFSDFDEAVKVRKEAEKIYFGEYSYDESMKKAKKLNIPIISEQDFINMIS